MKAIGKISNITVAYQQEKTGQDGHQFWGERYTIHFESGDDVHMIDSGWLHCQGKDGGAVILERRGIKTGAVGEMLFRYGVREYNGRQFPECVLVRFDAMASVASAPPLDIAKTAIEAKTAANAPEIASNTPAGSTTQLF